MIDSTSPESADLLLSTQVSFKSLNMSAVLIRPRTAAEQYVSEITIPHYAAFESYVGVISLCLEYEWRIMQCSNKDVIGARDPFSTIFANGWPYQIHPLWTQKLALHALTCFTSFPLSSSWCWSCPLAEQLGPRCWCKKGRKCANIGGNGREMTWVPGTLRSIILVGIY